MVLVEKKLLLSYNELKHIRKHYRGFKIHLLAPYHCNNKKRSAARMKTELMIRNF